MNPIATLFLLAHVSRLFFSLLCPVRATSQSRRQPGGSDVRTGTRADTAMPRRAVSSQAWAEVFFPNPAFSRKA